ncbi:MAG: hypothetical protein NWF05_11395 [Candidatus Bathyarchaeota archaeon]|nr:hypothetical protein [Candidatus Bathyarchaeota archaeon]
MKARVAVSTVNGKAYFLIVTELHRRGIPFLSLLPEEAVPAQIRVVVTTEEEKPRVEHHKILVYDLSSEIDVLGSEVVKVLQGKEVYETVVVGVDPGEVTGLAMLADGAVIENENCFSVKETLNSIQNILKTVDAEKSSVTVKVGSGVPVYRALLEALDEALPPEVTLEIVGEAGTNGRARGVRHVRGLRHIISAIRIAERAGYVYSRRKTIIERYS